MAPRKAKYVVYYDPRKERAGPAVAIKGPKGTRRAQLDGKTWKINGRKLKGYGETSKFTVKAQSYSEARELAHKKFSK